MRETPDWADFVPALGCWFGAWLAWPTSTRLTLAVGAIILCLLVWQVFNNCSRKTVLVLAAALSLPLTQGPQQEQRLARGLTTATLCVREVRAIRSSDGTMGASALVEIVAGKHLASDERLPRRTRLWVQKLDAAPGTYLEALLDVRPQTHTNNPQAPFRWPRRAHGSARLVGAWHMLDQPFFSAWLHKARAKLRAIIFRDLEPRTAAFVAALTLGDQALVDKEDYARVQSAGVAHLLAVSGLHIGIMSLVTLWFIRTVLFRTASSLRSAMRFNVRRISHVCAVPLALLHGLVAGGSPSALRASWMVALAHLAIAMGLRPNPHAALLALPICAATYDEALLRRPAFALSFVACLVLASEVRSRRTQTSGKQRQNLRSLFQALRTSVRLSTRIAVATLPIVVSCFGQLAWAGIVTNSLLVPIAGVLLVPMAHLQLLLALVKQGEHLAPLTELTSNALYSSCGWFGSKLPPIVFPSLTPREVCALSFASMAFFVRRRRQAALLILSGALLITPLFARTFKAHAEQALHVTFLDVGQGDATLIEGPSNKVAMIDIGGTVSFSAAQDHVARQDVISHALRARGIESLDLLVISHAHPDHFAAWENIKEEVSIKELWLPALGLEDEGGWFRSLVENARRKDTHVRLASSLCEAPQFPLGDELRFEIISPCERPSPDASLNDASLVVRMHYKHRSILFAGDIEAAAEQQLVATRSLHAEIVKVPHHGSRTSSTAAFVDAVDPQLAVISSGRANRFGHPHAEVVERWQATSCVLLTAEQGGIALQSKGDRWHFLTLPHGRACAEQLDSQLERTTFALQQ